MKEQCLLLQKIENGFKNMRRRKRGKLTKDISGRDWETINSITVETLWKNQEHKNLVNFLKENYQAEVGENLKEDELKNQDEKAMNKRKNIVK